MRRPAHGFYMSGTARATVSSATTRAAVLLTIRPQIEPLVRPQHLHGRRAALDDLVVIGDQRAFQFTGQRDVVGVRAAKGEPSCRPRSGHGQRQIHLAGGRALENGSTESLKRRPWPNHP